MLTAMKGGDMPQTFIWYSFDELCPRDKEWVLIADDRFKTPVKAQFKDDCGRDELNHIGHLDLFDESYRMPDGGFSHAYAWTPLPPMPTRRQMDGGRRDG